MLQHLQRGQVTSRRVTGTVFGVKTRADNVLPMATAWGFWGFGLGWGFSGVNEVQERYKKQSTP